MVRSWCKLCIRIVGDTSALQRYETFVSFRSPILLSPPSILTAAGGLGRRSTGSAGGRSSSTIGAASRLLPITTAPGEDCTLDSRNRLFSVTVLLLHCIDDLMGAYTSTNKSSGKARVRRDAWLAFRRRCLVPLDKGATGCCLLVGGEHMVVSVLVVVINRLMAKSK